MGRKIQLGRNLCLFTIIVVLCTALNVQADVKLHGLFTNNMVLQQEMPVPVWGTADAGEQVTVTFGEQKKSATAGNDGKWMVKLDALKAGGPYEFTVAGKNSITLSNVLVGEVWICSGQSNMEFSLGGAINAKDEIAAANYPKLRHFYVPHKGIDTPQTDVTGTWKECTPATAGSFTAVGYFFARDLQKAINVPIGLIHTSVGGTAAELWTSRRTLEGNPELKPIVDNFPKQLERYQKDQENYKAAKEKHTEAVLKAKADGTPVPTAPKAPYKPTPPSGLYNGMIAPLLPYAIRGATWYQGEANAGNGKGYRTLFPAMIKNWREDWGQGDFPFLFVQLANFMQRKPDPANSSWAELREAQFMTLALPKTGMAVIIDVGDAKDIHPKNKQAVGQRLALAAQHVAYGKELVYSGPIFDLMSSDASGSKLTLKFKQVGGGLVQGPGDKLTGFAVAGEDKKFVWADAKIDGETVIVSSEAVAKPIAVRYAWADNPECNLYNKENLPASPFRSDDWPH